MCTGGTGTKAVHPGEMVMEWESKQAVGGGTPTQRGPDLMTDSRLQGCLAKLVQAAKEAYVRRRIIRLGCLPPAAIPVPSGGTSLYS
jgi:hypothetical protein